MTAGRPQVSMADDAVFASSGIVVDRCVNRCAKGRQDEPDR
jgi:hypothetical protein